MAAHKTNPAFMTGVPEILILRLLAEGEMYGYELVQAIEAANVAVLTLDAVDGVTEQDAHVAGYILERGRAVVLAVNKWDAADKAQRERMKAELQWKLGFLGFAAGRAISG